MPHVAARMASRDGMLVVTSAIVETRTPFSIGSLTSITGVAALMAEQGRTLPG